MVHIILLWDSLISLFVYFPTCHLLSVLESEAVFFVIASAKQSVSSTRRSLPVRQQLFMDFFVKVIVGTALIPDELIQNQDLSSLSDADAPVVNFKPDKYMTQAWNDNSSYGNQCYGRRAQLSIRNFLGTRLPVQNRDRHALGHLDLVIVVRLVPDWWKITSLFLAMGCIVIAWTNKPADEAAIFIVIITAVVVVYLACHVLYRLLDQHEFEANDSYDATFAGNARVQSRFPEQQHDGTRPRLHHHNTWGGTGTAIGGRIPRTYSLCAQSQTPSYQDYTVGWISALPIEFATARASLDEVYESLPAPYGDDNTYILGRIGLHNVVITCLPSGRYGPVPAAAVATRMLSTFPSIRFGVMVGIGGGVPSQADIRLGDVVVSKPSVRSGGVLRCGMDFEQTSTLNNPPLVLLNAMSNLRATHLVEGHRISELLSSMLNRNPALTDSVIPTESDRLFAACYNHSGETASCNNCDERHLIVRKNRAGLIPQVHYGQIASITRVLKNGVIRDDIARRLGGTFCFEMEAAGLMDNFPCLVIRGISDYADSHKNDHWQGYAAATAAAYAKELLSVITPRQVTTEREASQLYV